MPAGGHVIRQCRGCFRGCLHSSLRAACAGMSRQCSDDAAVLLRSAWVFRLFAPIFDDAGRFAGVRLKPANFAVVLVGRDRGPMARAAVAAEISAIFTEWCAMQGNA